MNLTQRTRKKDFKKTFKSLFKWSHTVWVITATVKIYLFHRGTKFYGQSIVCLNRTAKLFWFFLVGIFFFHFLFIFGKIYNKMWVFCFCFCKKTWEIIIFLTEDMDWESSGCNGGRGQKKLSILSGLTRATTRLIF